MDDYRIDSHKLIYHPDRVLSWFKTGDTYPIYAEIAAYGGCNHRCIFCALDYLGYHPVLPDTKVFKKFISGIASKGARSIMFAGEGEPLLNKDLPQLISHAKKNGLDIAITTNGVLLTKDIALKILSKLSWLRISLNAGTKKTYSLVHRTNPKDFDKVIVNIKEAVKIRNKKGLNCVIGAQFLLLNENLKEAGKLASLLKNIGVDYLIIKPYSQHPSSLNRLKTKLKYDKLLSLEKGLKKYESKKFKIIFRKHAMEKLAHEKPYAKCFGLPFWVYLTATGDLYACSAFLGDERFCYGNIYKDSFIKLWHSPKRKKIIKMMADKWNMDDCREVCRLDEVNRYLWELKNPPPHVNFV